MCKIFNDLLTEKNGNRPGALDAIIIGGDVPGEYLGKDVREKMRLTIDGYPASLRFMQQYFMHDRNAEAAQAELLRDGLPFVSLNGPYLCEFLESRGLHAGLVPLLSTGKELLTQMLAQKPAVIVISTTFLPFAEHIDAIAAAVKKIAPQIPVIAGGIQVWKSFRHNCLLNEGIIGPNLREAISEHNYFTSNRPSPVDLFLVNAAGEHTLARIIESVKNGDDPAALPNVAVFRDGAWQINPVEPEPYREVKVDWHKWPQTAQRVYHPIQAGQGCGFECAFCDFRGLRAIRLRPAASIVAEIRTMPEDSDGFRRVYFTDDNLFTSRTRARELCNALLKSGMRLRWRGMARISIIDDEIAELMAQTGCIEVLLGIESGDPNILQAMGKNVSPEQILDGLECLTRHGINTKSTFIVGFPGETAATVRNTVELLNAYPTEGPALHRYLIFRFGVLPLSRIAMPDQREKYGLEGYGYHWRHSTMTSEEAAVLQEQAHHQIKETLSPSYLLEVPELPGLDIEAIKRAAVLRNRLAALRNEADENLKKPLWDKLAAVFT